MEELTIQMKLNVNDFEQANEILTKIEKSNSKTKEVALNLIEVDFIKDLLESMVKSTMQKVHRLESISNDFINCYETIEK